MSRLTSALWLSAIGTAVAACGGLAGDTNHYATLATLHGHITNDKSVQTVTQSNPNGDMRVAVVWLAETDNSVNVAVDVQVTPKFPSEFAITLNQPPPDSVIATKKNAKASSSNATVDAPPSSTGVAPGDTSANSSAGSGGTGGSGAPAPSGMGAAWKNAAANAGKIGSVRTQSYQQTDWPDGFGIAVGAVVAYQDLNGNGKLDLINPNDTKYIDRVLGANDQLLLVYVEGDVPPVTDFMDDAGKLPLKGYNIFRLSTCSAVLNTAGSGSSCKDSVTWLGMDTWYELPLSDDPKISQLMCSSSSGFEPGSDAPTEVSGGSAGTSSDPGSGGTFPGPVETDDGGAAVIDSGAEDGGSAPDGGADDGGPAPDGGATDAGAARGPAVPGYPDPSDPNLHCSSDGRSFYYIQCDPTPMPVQTTPSGLCGSSGTAVSDVQACGGPDVVMPSPEPSNWPCNVK